MVGYNLGDEPTLPYFYGLREARYVILKMESGPDHWENYPILNKLYDVNIENIEKRLDLIPQNGNFKPIFSNLKPYRVFDLNDTSVASVAKQYNGFITKAIKVDREIWTPFNDYQQYYASYMSNVTPPFLCFDAYPFEQRFYGSHNGVKLKSIFFLSLAFYSSLGSDFPFWATIQTCDVGTYKMVNGKPALNVFTSCGTLGKLRFAAFCSLAFGAQGLMYWRMAPNKDKDPNDTTDWEQYCNAPINNDGT